MEAVRLTMGVAAYLLLARSCGRYDLPESNAQHLMQSLARLAKLHPGLCARALRCREALLQLLKQSFTFLLQLLLFCCCRHRWRLLLRLEGHMVLPGHNYAAPAHSTISQERELNGIMQSAVARSRARSAGGPGVAPKNVSGSIDFVLLPDYLAAARKAFEAQESRGPGCSGGCGCISAGDAPPAVRALWQDEQLPHAQSKL